MSSICALDYLNRSAFFIFYQISDYVKHGDISHKAQKDIIIHLDIIARYIFSILILKIKVFKHHKLAIIIIFIGFIILIPTDIILKKIIIDDYVLSEVLLFLRYLEYFVIILVITSFLYFYI